MNLYFLFRHFIKWRRQLAKFCVSINCQTNREKTICQFPTKVFQWFSSIQKTPYRCYGLFAPHNLFSLISILPEAQVPTSTWVHYYYKDGIPSITFSFLKISKKIILKILQILRYRTYKSMCYKSQKKINK